MKSSVSWDHTWVIGVSAGNFVVQTRPAGGFVVRIRQSPCTGVQAEGQIKAEAMSRQDLSVEQVKGGVTRAAPRH